jgi:hypothetical protein
MKWYSTYSLKALFIFSLAFIISQGEEFKFDITVEVNCSDFNVTSRNCVELDEALVSTVSGITLYLRPGTHVIHNSTILRNMSNISIIGQAAPGDCNATKNEVIITCDEGQGLLFSQISRLLLKDVTISECGAQGEALNETINIVYDHIQFVVRISPYIRIAIFMGLCEDVVMENVTVTNTTGIGLVGVNIFGQSRLYGVEFTHNRHYSCYPVNVSDELVTGGGAYFFYGNPTSSNGTRMPANVNSTSDTILLITESRFAFNSDCSRISYHEANYRYILTSNPNAFYSIGGGGGLSTFLAQTRYSVNVTVSSTEFSMNGARYGGGAHVGLFSGIALGTTISFMDCFFISNSGVPTQNEATGGGGLAVFTGLTNPLHAHVSLPSNEVVVYVVHSCFVGNNATKGGGLFTFSLFDSLPSLTDIPEADTFDTVFYLYHCNFLYNAGPYGAALSLQQRTAYGYDGKVVALIGNVNVSESTHPAGGHGLFGNMDSSAIHLESVYASVFENLNVSDNDMAGIFIHSSTLIISPNATLSISRNTGVLGGGIHLTGRSPLIAAFPHSSLSFRHNRAMIQGGAIYVTPETLSADDILLPITSDCFFVPISVRSGCSSASECNNFTALDIHVSFEGNSAPLGSVVYGSTLESCYWVNYLQRQRDKNAPGLTILEFISMKQPPLFEIDQALNYSSTINTAPSSISVDIPPLLNLMPGQKIKLAFTVTDDYGNMVPAVLSSLVSSSSDNRSNVSSTLGESGYWFVDSSTRSLTTFQLTGAENSSVNVTFFTTTHLTTTEVSFNLSACPLGVIYDSATSSCTCDPRLSPHGVSCDNSTFKVTVPDHMWMGTIMGDSAANSGEDVLITRCNTRYCREGNKMFEQDNFDSQCSPDLQRSGLLCGQCAPNTSALLGSNSCRKCSNYSILLIPIFGLAGILLFVTIALLGFTIDKGWINIVLFYCNFLSLRGSVVLMSTYSVDYIFVPSSLISLQLGVGLCFYDGMTPLAKIGLQLVFPFYLYILMAIFALLCRKYYWLSERFSPTTTFVTLLIMCYVSTLTTCITILAKKTVYTLGGQKSVRWLTDANQEYFADYHIPLVLIAAVLMVVYVIPFPFLMLCPKFLYRYVKKFIPFYDAFWAPYTTRYRFWLGIRLIIRLVLFTLPELIYYSLIITTWVLLILLYLQLVFKPFKSNMINYVDNFLIGTIVMIMIGALFTESGGGRVIEHFTRLLEVLERVLLIIIVLIGYATVTGIFVYLLRERLTKAKSVILSRIKTIGMKPKASMAVTHSEVSLDNDQSVVQSTDIILADLEENRDSILKLETVDPPPVVLRERERFARLRESLLES